MFEVLNAEWETMKNKSRLWDETVADEFRF